MDGDTTKMRHCLVVDHDMLAAVVAGPAVVNSKLAKAKQPMSNGCRVGLFPVLSLLLSKGGEEAVLMKC